MNDDLSIFDSSKEEVKTDISLDDLSLDKTKYKKSKKIISVNGKNGEIVLNTDDVEEGSINKYFSRAKLIDIINDLIKNESLIDKELLEKRINSIRFPKEHIEGNSGELLILVNGNPTRSKIPLEELINLIEEYKQESVDIKNELDVVKNAIVKALEEINSKLSDTEEVSLKNNIEELKENLQLLSDKVLDIENNVYLKISNVVTTNDKVKTSLNLITESINCLNNNIKNLSSSLELIKKNNKDLSIESNNLSQKNDILLEKISSIESVVMVQDEKISNLEKENIKIKSDYSTLDSNFKNLSIDVVNLKTECNSKISSLNEKLNKIGIINFVKRIFNKE
jgi:chromosome segregation ATPase